MNRQHAKKHTGRRVLAVLLSLLMLLQSVSALAGSVDVPETNPTETASVPAETGDTSETPPAETGTADEKASEDGKETDPAPVVTDDIPAAGGDGPAEPAEIPGDSADTPDGNGGNPAENDGPEDDKQTPAEDSGIPEETDAIPATTPVIDTSESITMLMAGFDPTPVWFEGTLIHEGPDYTVTAVIGQDAMFPLDVSMRVEEILPGTELYEYYIQMMEETMEEDEEMGEFARFFDIAFIAEADGEETELEPQADIDVQITFREAIAVTEETDVQAVHIADDVPQILDASTDSLEAAVYDDEAIDTISFSSDSFSVYGVYQKVKKILKVITASGETFTIDVTFTTDSGIPEDADLSAAEITPDNPIYDMYRAKAVMALDAGDVGSAHFFDIQISKDGEKIEPEGPVTVSIALDEMPEDAETVAVVHFGEAATSVIEDVAVSEADIQFQTDSFSVYGVITDPNNEANNLNGKIATIGRNGEYLTAEQVEAANGEPMLIGKTNNANNAALYYFVSTGETGKYYIYTIDPDTQEKKYINFRYRGNNDPKADCFLSDTPQPLSVQQFGDDYRISWQYGSISFALDHWNSYSGQGFGGYLIGSSGGINDNQRMRLNFVSGSGQNENKYVVIIKHEGQYYTVQNDGSLIPCTYHADTNMVEMDAPIMWTYSSVYGNSAYNLKIAEEAVEFDSNQLPTRFAYRYIDPNTDSGISHDIVHQNGNSQYVESQTEACRMIYTNHTIYGLEHNSTNYLGVTEENGKLKICGNKDQASAAEVYMAIPMLPSSAYGTTNAVNHIDIRVSGSTNLSLAFAYGTYYLPDGTEITIDKDHPYTYTATNYAVTVKQDDLMRSEIETYKVNADGSTTPLDDMFYVTGYSDNGNNSELSPDQVRIEGFFKVSYTNVPGQNGNWESRQARLATPVYYTVTVPKDVEIPLMYNYNGTMVPVYAKNPQTNSGEEPVTASTTVTLSSSFTYWDYANNTCPTCRNVMAGGNWYEGDIPDGFNGDGHTGSGMDFVLNYAGSSGTIALEVIKYVVDEQGNPIQVTGEPKYTFDLYYTQDKDANYAADHSGSEDASVLDTLDLDSYIKLHTMNTAVGSNGSGTLYDYDISRLLTSSKPYALFYIQEDPDSIDQTIVDQNGDEWHYTGKTRIVTEYVKRPDAQPDHEVEGLTAFPEVIGTFRIMNSSGQGAGQTKTNAFLEFHVYNEYTNDKAKIQITKYLVDENNNIINPMTPVENTFTLYRNSQANPDDVKGLNQGSYQTPYDEFVSAYTTEGNTVSTEQITVGTSGWALTYKDVSAGMYTVQEDKDSVPDQIIDTQGNIWEYTGTEIQTEYVRRTDQDRNQRHFSDTFTKSSGNYTAVPEVAGAYTDEAGNEQNNEYLEFFVYNKYVKTNQPVESSKMNLQLNKLWNKDGDTTALSSGSVTFRLHQIKTTTTTEQQDDPNPAQQYTINLRYANGSIVSTTEWDGSSPVHITFKSYTTWKYIHWFYDHLYNWDDGNHFSVQSDGAGNDSENLSIDRSKANQNGIINIYLDANANDFEVAPRISATSGGGGGGGSSGSGTSTTTTEYDPMGSGFPMDIVLTPDDNWQSVQNNLLAQVVQGNTTINYSYYLEEISRTGKAASYPIVSYENDLGKDMDHAVSGTGDHTLNVTNTYDSTIPEDKMIDVKKIWEDQDGNPLVNHPTEILVDIWRMKLPGTASSSGGIMFNSVGGLYDAIGQPSTWQDNNNVIMNDVVFYISPYYYYIRVGQTNFSRWQLESWAQDIANGRLDGDHITRLTGNVWTLEEVKEMARNNVYIERGDICYYDGDYWVFRHTSGAFGSTGHTWGPDVDGNWSRIGTANILSGVTIDLMPNDQYLTEEYIREHTIPELYEYIDEQLEGSGVTWSDEDKELVKYMENVPITEAMDWESVFRVDTGYLYFVFEHPIPGYTTTYGYEEYGVYEQEHGIEIVNKTTRGKLDVTKTWSGENDADKVYFILQQNGLDDITVDIMEAPENYGLTDDDVNRNANYISLILTKTGDEWNTLHISNLMLADYYTVSPDDDEPCRYTVKEIGYHDATGDHWDLDGILAGYSMSEQGGETTRTEAGAEVSGEVELGTTASTITIHNETSTEFSFTKTWKKNGVIIDWPAEETISVMLNADTDTEQQALSQSFTLSSDSHEGWEATVNEDKSVTFRISGLNAFDNGHALTYYVIEDAMEGYSTCYADASGEPINQGSRALDGQMIINTSNDVLVIKQKYSASDLKERMTGAKFRLDRKETDDEGTAYVTVQAATEVSPEEETLGTLLFEGLTDGEYRIVETKAPAGYMSLASAIEFTIENGELTYSGTSTLVTYEAATENSPATFRVDNKPGTALPSTGGNGTAAYTATGLAMMILAGILLAERKRKAHK